MSMTFNNGVRPAAERATAGLSENLCWPITLVNDPGFALLADDPYVIANPPQYNYRQDPPVNLIAGRTPPFKRDLSMFDDDMQLLDGSSAVNVSREFDEGDEVDNEAVEVYDLIRAYKDDMDNLAYAPCVDEECATELTPALR